MVKCPKCKCKELLIREIGAWITIHNWDGTKCTGHNQGPGSYEKVFAVCESCGYSWRLKNRVQFYCEDEEADIKETAKPLYNKRVTKRLKQNGGRSAS
jgi:hypothetical protein